MKAAKGGRSALSLATLEQESAGLHQLHNQGLALHPWPLLPLLQGRFTCCTHCTRQLLLLPLLLLLLLLLLALTGCFPPYSLIIVEKPLNTAYMATTIMANHSMSLYCWLGPCWKNLFGSVGSR